MALPAPVRAAVHRGADARPRPTRSPGPGLALEPPGPPGDRRQDGDHVAVVELGVERAEEADVLVVDVDVHEAVQRALLGEELGGDARVAPLEIADQVADGPTLGADALGAIRVFAQDRRDTHFDSHQGDRTSYRSRDGGAALTRRGRAVADIVRSGRTARRGCGSHAAPAPPGRPATGSGRSRPDRLPARRRCARGTPR